MNSSKLLQQTKLPEAPSTSQSVRRTNTTRDNASNRRTTTTQTHKQTNTPKQIPTQTPILKLTREIKSRLPRVTPTPTPISQTGGSLSNSDSTKLRVKKSLNHNPKTNNLKASSSSTFTPSPHKSPALSESNLFSESSIDLDQTPQKLRPGPAPKTSNIPPVDGNRSIRQNGRSKGPDDQTKGNTNFPTIVEDLTPKRPMTRARSKHLLKLSTSTQASSHTGIPVPQVKRKTSRVIEIAQNFQSQSSEKSVGIPKSARKLSRNSSQNLLGVTPGRRKSDASTISFVSPPGSMISNSPNISALAASLTKQFVKRDRSTKGKSSVADMLRYSTMSTLGELKWEDGVDQVLLTDPNETEAMVADISMTKVTPLKSEVQSAAIALASARENFLSIFQENDETMIFKGEGGRVQEILKDLSPPSHFEMLKKGTPSSYNNHGLSPLSRSRISCSSSNSPSNRVIAQEVQLASMSISLEKSHQREIELENKIKQLLSKEDKQSQNKNNGVLNQEREKSLEEEIKRLENELEEFKETNIELENSLDLIKFENQENIKKIQNLLNHHHQQQQQQNSLLLTKTCSPDNNNCDDDQLDLDVNKKIIKFEKFDLFDKNLINYLLFIKESLQTLSVIKTSLALSAHLFLSEQDETQ